MVPKDGPVNHNTLKNFSWECLKKFPNFGALESGNYP